MVPAKLNSRILWIYNQVDDLEGLLEVQHSIYVSDPEVIYTYNYDFEAAAYTDCGLEAANICLDCVYEVEIKIIPKKYNPNCRIEDDDNNYIDVDDNNVQNPAGEVIKTFTVGSITNFDLDCEDPVMTFSGENPGQETFKVKYPKRGNYTIIKTLKVSHAPINYYWQGLCG